MAYIAHDTLYALFFWGCRSGQYAANLRRVYGVMYMVYSAYMYFYSVCQSLISHSTCTLSRSTLSWAYMSYFHNSSVLLSYTYRRSRQASIPLRCLACMLSHLKISPPPYSFHICHAYFALKFTWNKSPPQKHKIRVTPQTNCWYVGTVYMRRTDFETGSWHARRRSGVIRDG